MITPISCNYNHPTFNANLASPRLKFSQHDFFIKIRGYGKDKNWAQEIIETADSAVRMIRKNRGIENILRMISLGVYRLDLQVTQALLSREVYAIAVVTVKLARSVEFILRT